MKRSGNYPYILILPSLCLIGFTELYPMLSGIWYSLNKGSVVQRTGFVGLNNFVRIFQDEEFLQALAFNWVFVAGVVVASYLIGLLLAMFLNKDFPGKNVARALLLLPWVVPSIVTAFSWQFMMSSPDADLNRLLGLVGLGPIPFLAVPNYARLSVIIVKTWRSFPFMMITLTAALQTITKEQYEAATIDGAGRLGKFYYITMPHIKLISIISCVLMVIWCTNDFETIYLLTKGGPLFKTENLMLLAYRYAFMIDDVGISAAVAVVSLVIMMTLASVIFRLQKQE